MKVGIISTTQGVAWSAADQIWLTILQKGISNGDTFTLSVDNSLTEARTLTEADTSPAVTISHRIRFRPNKLFRLKEHLDSSYSIFEKQGVDVVLISGGSIFDGLQRHGLERWAKNTNIPLVFFCNGHSEYYEVDERERLSDFLAHMRAIIFVSEMNKSTVEYQLGETLPNASVLRNPPPFTCEAPLPWPSETVLQMACVSRLSPFWKGHEVLCKALSAPQWARRQWKLHCFGAGAERAWLQKIVRNYGLEDRISFPGHQADVTDIWKSHHILLHPSKAEGFSIAVLEAMMCGRPVLSTDVGDHFKEVLEGKTGFLAQAPSLHSIEATLERAWDERERWKELGENAHRQVLPLCSINTADAVLQILSDARARSSTIQSASEQHVG